MIKIKFEGLDKTMRLLEQGDKQVRYAASRAINTVAFETMREGRAHIQARLNRPTNWTVKAWYVRKKAVKTDLVASVGWSDYLANKRGHAAEYYLAQHWHGGGREHRAFETRLQRSGLMPQGHYAVLGKAAQEMGMLDGNGNMKGSVLVQILSSLGAFKEAGYNANATVSRSSKLRGSKAAGKLTYWAGKPGPNTPNGIWVIDSDYSKRGRLRPVIVFVPSVRYTKRLDLEAVARKVQPKLAREFEKEYAAALRTAR